VGRVRARQFLEFRMFPIARIKAILLSPKTEWPVIEAERTDVASIYRDYLVWLAAIPAIASFVGFSLVGIGGIGGMGVTFRVPVLAGLVNALVSFVLGLVLVYVMALIANALAPKFQGRPDFLAAFKLVAYAGTASMVAGLAYLLPSLSMLALLGSLYSVYLIRQGLPVLMKCPPGRATMYTVVLMVCGFAVGLAFAALSALFTPSPARVGGAGQTTVTPGAALIVDAGRPAALART
jgi:hypothetical protein